MSFLYWFIRPPGKLLELSSATAERTSDGIRIDAAAETMGSLQQFEIVPSGLLGRLVVREKVQEEPSGEFDPTKVMFGTALVAARPGTFEIKGNFGSSVTLWDKHGPVVVEVTSPA